MQHWPLCEESIWIMLSYLLYCLAEGRTSGFFFYYFTFLENKSLLKEGSLKIGEEQESRVMRWKLQLYKSKSSLKAPPLPLERWLDFLWLSSLCPPSWCPPRQDFLIPYTCMHMYVCFHCVEVTAFGEVLLCVWSSGTLPVCPGRKWYFIPRTLFTVRQDWIVFADQSCFANFAVYMGIYDSLSLGRNGIEVCLNLLRVSDWFCSHRTSF